MTMDNEKAAQFQKQEKKTLDTVRGTLQYYWSTGNRAARWQRAIGVTLLVCSVLSPLFIISPAADANDFRIFGMGETTMARIALVLSLITAFAEGLRRLFRPEERWSACYMSAETLKTARDEYRLKRIALPVGGDEWIANLKALREVLNTTVTTESRQFFESMASGKGPQSGNGSA